MTNPRKNTIEDYYKRIVKQDNGCWEFQSYADRDGYRFFTIDGKEWKAHRLAVVLDGRDPSGKVVMHHCDNPSCVNPAHLSVATQKENALDCVNKGRNPGNRWPTRKGYRKIDILKEHKSALQDEYKRQSVHPEV